MNDPPEQMGRADVPRPVASIAMLYAGLLIGVSFIATPAKFLAPSITLAQALDVGRCTFRIFGWVELGLVTLLLALCLACRRFQGMGLIIAVLAAVVFQVLLLRPLLDARLAVILDGGTPQPSQLHNVYGLIEVGKIVALLFIGWGHTSRAALRSLEQRSLLRDSSDSCPPPITTPRQIGVGANRESERI